MTGKPTHPGLWVDEDDAMWLAVEHNHRLMTRRVIDKWDAVYGDAWIPVTDEWADYGYREVTFGIPSPATTVDAPDRPGLYRAAPGTIWAYNGEGMLTLVRNSGWGDGTTTTPAEHSPHAPWTPVPWWTVDAPVKPWKPEANHADLPEQPSRVVTIPPIRSFGRLQADKWLALKTLEESAELVEAAKRWLKPKDESQADDVLAAARKAGVLPATLEPDDRTRIISRWDSVRDGRDRLDMLDELADVLQTLANLIVAYRVSDAELKDALDRCTERNRRKGRL